MPVAPLLGAFAILAAPIMLGNAPTPAPRALTTGITVGEPAPDFALTTLDNKAITLDDVRGQVIVIHMWGAWCKPCKAQMPMLDAYFRANQAKGLQIFGIETGYTVGPRRLRKISERYAYPLTSRFRGDPYVRFDLWPTTYVIDRAGIVRFARAVMFSPDGFDALVSPLLAEKPPVDAAPH
ncbi:MAG: peroxiredoxin family protein [Sphingomonas sp.]